MTEYTTIYFQTKDNAFKDDDALTDAVMEATGNCDIQVKRETYEDGTWSGWFSLKGPKDSPSIRQLAFAMEKMPGVDQGSIMLKTATEDIEPLHLMPGPDYSFGALDPRNEAPGDSPKNKPKAPAGP